MTDLPEPIQNCPIFGTPVNDVTNQVAATPCESGGDYVALQDRDGYYCISGSVLSLICTNPLNDAEKARVREWLRERRRHGCRCPMIKTAVLHSRRDPVC